jgi:hypothetical protein
MLNTLTKHFSVNTVRDKKSLEYMTKWKNTGCNVSDKINRAIEYYGALEEQQQQEKQLQQQEASSSNSNSSLEALQ